MPSAISASPSPRAMRRRSLACSAPKTMTTDLRKRGSLSLSSIPFPLRAEDLHERTPVPLESDRIKTPYHHRASMITRRHLIRSIGGLSALGVSTVAYGVGVEPALLLKVTRYHPTPRQWPADFPLKI